MVRRLAFAVAATALFVLAAQRAHGGESGSLNLGFVGSATYDVLPSVLRAFRQAAPDVNLTLSEMTAHAQLEGLVEKRIDVGLLRLPAKTEGIAFRRISREPLYVALPGSHRLAQFPALRLSALKEEPFVLYPDHPRPSWTEFVIGLCQQADFRPIIVQRTVEIQTTVEVSQPNALSSGGTTQVVPQVNVAVKQDPARNLVLKDGATVEELVQALT